MKIFNLVSNIVIIVAFVLMWALHPKSADKSDNCDGNNTATSSLKVAYVNIDSVLLNYQKAIDLNEEMMTQQEAARTDLTSKARKLEADMMTFQRKVENNGFLSRERAESEQQRLMGEQQKLEQEQQRISNELALKQQDVNEDIMSSITDYVAEMNKGSKYDFIFTQTGGIGTILTAGSAYNISAKVLTDLNEQYAKK